MLRFTCDAFKTLFCIRAESQFLRDAMLEQPLKFFVVFFVVDSPAHE
jgi:hypothetical protein